MTSRSNSFSQSSFSYRQMKSVYRFKTSNTLYSRIDGMIIFITNLVFGFDILHR